MINAPIAVLRITGLLKRYADFTLGPVDLEVPLGSVVGLVGQNGAGKTTLMKAVFGMVRTDGGTVELMDRDVATLAPGELSALRTEVGFVVAECAYPLSMTVPEVARMYALAYPRFDQDAFRRYCAELDLTTNRKVSDLSRGMGMKLQLACALASGARLLVLDEPTAGLDPVVREETLDVLRAWLEPGDRSLLVSSHITGDLEHLADSLVLLHDGKVALAFDHEELAAMGVARLRSAELDEVLASHRYTPGTLRLCARDLSRELLVPDRKAFLAAWPDCVCDPASIDDIMTFVVKGEVR